MMTDEQMARAAALMAECKRQLIVIADEAGVKACDASSGDCAYPFCLGWKCPGEPKESATAASTEVIDLMSAIKDALAPKVTP